MIKQKYKYRFFYDNYKYTYISMAKRYNKMQDKKYRYFIKVDRDINSHSEGTYEIYRSNNNIDEILQELDLMSFVVAEIVDNWSKFPQVSQYIYLKNVSFKQIVKTYKHGHSETRKLMDDTVLYSYWASYEKTVMSVNLSENIEVACGNYRFTSSNDRIEVRRLVPLSDSVKMKYNSDHRDMIEKVLKKLNRDNLEGFYDEMICKVRENFGIRGV